MSSDDKRTDSSIVVNPVTRRDFLKVAGLGAAALGLGGGVAGAVSACGSDSGSSSGSTGRDIKIGFVSPLTGPLAAFGEADQYCVERWNEAVKGGVKINGKTHKINIIIKDSQSDSNRAATVAGDLITNDGVDIMMAASTPDTVPPVADQAEALGVPMVSNDCPWQPYYFGRGATPDKPFKWTYHFFWGSESAAAVFTDLFGKVNTNKTIGVMWPNDADGLAWADKKTGMPPLFTKAGYKFIDTGRYQDGSEDFTPQISKFKSSGAEILNGVMIPPDFTNFWKQAYQQGFRPKIATMAKALLFPSALEALGDIGYGLSTEVWWTPSHPFSSSLSGETSKQLGADYEKRTGKQWTQPLMHYAVFEVVVDALKRTADVDDKEAILDAIIKTDIQTIAGPVSWNGGKNNPVKNVSITPLVGGQWVKGTTHPYDLVIVGNTVAPEVPTTAEFTEMKY